MQHKTPLRETFCERPPLTLHFVFISYAHADREFVTRLRIDLQEQGIDVWVDKEGIQVGTTDWEESLRRAIQAAHAVLFIASPNARNSRFVKDELRIAEMFQLTIYPLWIAGNHWMEAAPIGLGGIQYYDVRGAAYQMILPDIVKTLHRTFKEGTTILPPSSAPEIEPRNPYKGLHAFRPEDARDFFGRTRLIHELVQSVQQMLALQGQDETFPRLLAVIGASGSGKSSVVMAGLLSHLQQGALVGSRDWLYFDPTLPGKHPLEALTLTLSRHFPARSLTSIAQDLEADSARGLHLLIASLVKGTNKKAVLFLDQFEELFTQTTSESERRHLLDLLIAAATETNGPVILLLTLRADFYDRPLQYPNSEIGRLIEAHHVVMFPMELKDFREVIEQPAQLPDVQLTFEAGLVGDLLFDVWGQSGALPLLQFTLDQLFQRRHGLLLTHQAYEDLGGVKGALAQHAEVTYLSLSSEAHRDLTRALFLRLIDAGTLEQDATRRRAPLSELTLTDAKETFLLQDIVKIFTAARLLTAKTITGTATMEVSHEALISQWTRLHDWLSEAYEDTRLQKKLSEDVAAWIHFGKPTDRLYRGSQLLDAQAWRTRNIPSQDEETFLQASIAELEKERAVEKQKQRKYTRRTLLVAIGGVGLAAAAVSLSRYFFSSISSSPSSSPSFQSVVYMGHTDAVNSAAWSPDGKYIASASTDRTVQVWKAFTRERVNIYTNPIDAEYYAAWSPDGKYLILNNDRTVQVWGAPQSNITYTSPPGTPNYYYPTWSSDGKYLAWSTDTTLLVWEALTGKLVQIYTGPPGTLAYYYSTWSPDGKYLAWNTDTTVWVWEALTGNLMQLYTSPTRSYWLTRPGHLMVNTSPGILIRRSWVWEALTGKLVQLYTNPTTALTYANPTWSSDGKYLAWSTDTTVLVWEALTGKLVQNYTIPTAALTYSNPTWSPDGKYLAWSTDTTIRVWEAPPASSCRPTRALPAH